MTNEEREICVEYIGKYLKETDRSYDHKNWISKNPIPDSIKEFVTMKTTTEHGFLNWTYLEISNSQRNK